jgi:thiamine-monophosphate kinase
MTEFELIRQIFQQRAAYQVHRSPYVTQGIGDDCASLALAGLLHTQQAGQVGQSVAQELIVSTDMLVSGRHFVPDVAPRTLGHKALAVNLSDIAAMGGTPLGFTLSLALPPHHAGDAAWLHEFAAGLFALSEQFACPLIGGDTTRAAGDALTLNITILGQVNPHTALRRNGAQLGDDIWLSGTIGGAALGLQCVLNHADVGADIRGLLTEAEAKIVRDLLEQPQPRIALGQALNGIAHSALDVSDGLAGDLPHIVQASQCAAVIQVEQLPLHPMLQKLRTQLPDALFQQMAYGGGDDYELLFTAPPQSRDALKQISQSLQVPLTRCGTIVPRRVLSSSNDQSDWIEWRQHQARIEIQAHGFQHFE